MTEYLSTALIKKHHNTIVIKNKSEILGLLVLKGKKIPSLNDFPSLAIIIRILRKVGFKKALRFFSGILILEETPTDKDLLYINTIVVKKKHRGKGVGTILLNVVDKLVHQRKFAGSCLYVAEINYQAIRLYIKKGYKIKQVERSKIAYSLLGIYGFIYMMKRR
ncbi:MAG: GNAT family N-acetyltransferase [Candidatus Hodarchaeota archaeon]